MVRRLLLMTALVFALVGCSSSNSPNTVMSSVPVTDVTILMVGRWGIDGEEVLLLSLEDDRVVISAPANEAWRVETSDAKIVGDEIHFVRKYYLHNNAFHPFNGVACNRIAKIVDKDNLEFGITTEQSPEYESSILTRLE